MSKTASISPTTAQSLGALLKSARDIMRKDKGLNGDLDRLPMLTSSSSRREEARCEECEGPPALPEAQRRPEISTPT